MKPPTTAGLTALLAVIGLLNSFCSDMFIPALPSLRDDLQVSPLQAQQTISLFFGASALMSLWYGALADCWGRRRVVLGAVAIVGATAVGCIASRGIEPLWVLRTLQGLAASAGLVISRVIIRDLHSGLTAQRLLSRIMMVQTLSLVAAPLLGGWLAAAWGWRGVFVAIAAIMLALFVACWNWLPETLPRDQRRPLQPARLWRSYLTVLRHGGFVRLSLAHVANWVGMAIYVFSAPALIVGHLGRGAADTWLLFLPISVGLIGGFIVFARLSRRHQGAAVLRIAYRILAAAVLLNVALAALLAPGLIHTLPLFFLSVGVALALPILVDWALTPVHDNAGVAASCQTFLQFGAMALGAGLVAPLLWGSLLQLALGTGAIVGAGALCLVLERRSRQTTTKRATKRAVNLPT